MEKEKYQINLPVGVTEVIIREGEALPVVEPSQLKVVGQIYSPTRYITQRGTLVDKTKALVVVNVEDKVIDFYEDPTNPLAAHVKGKIVLEPKIAEFGINTGKRYKREELVQFLKFQKFYFPDKDQHFELMSKLRSFLAKIGATMQSGGDDRGNKINELKRTVTTDVPLDFIIALPIIKGGKMTAFRVEILLDVTDGGGSSFWFESTELKDLENELVQSLFETLLPSFEGFAVINC